MDNREKLVDAYIDGDNCDYKAEGLIVKLKGRNGMNTNLKTHQFAGLEDTVQDT